MDKHAPRTEPKHFATLVITVFSLLIFSLLTGCAGFYEKTGPDRLSPKTESDVSTAAHSPANNENKKDKDTPDKTKSAEENTGFKSPVVKDLKSDNTEKPATGDLIQDKIQSRFDKSLEFYQTAMEFWQHGDLENALESLDNGYALIISTDTGDDPAFIQQKDDLRFMISKRILEIYASRHTTVKGNHNAIPLEIDNEYVQREIEHFTSGNARKFFINSYKRSGRFRPYITKALREAGLPEELSWLPLVESGYRTNAMSHARALGMWQFIASTGYKFGLKRDPYLDERLDPHKSTHAAIDYLRELHEIFGD